MLDTQCNARGGRETDLSSLCRRPKRASANERERERDAKREYKLHPHCVSYSNRQAAAAAAASEPKWRDSGGGRENKRDTEDRERHTLTRIPYKILYTTKHAALSFKSLFSIYSFLPYSQCLSVSSFSFAFRDAAVSCSKMYLRIQEEEAEEEEEELEDLIPNTENRRAEIKYKAKGGTQAIEALHGPIPSDSCCSFLYYTIGAIYPLHAISCHALYNRARSTHLPPATSLYCEMRDEEEEDDYDYDDEEGDVALFLFFPLYILLCLL